MHSLCGVRVSAALTIVGKTPKSVEDSITTWRWTDGATIWTVGEIGSMSVGAKAEARKSMMIAVFRF